MSDRIDWERECTCATTKLMANPGGTFLENLSRRLIASLCDFGIRFFEETHQKLCDLFCRVSMVTVDTCQDGCSVGQLRCTT